MSQKKTSVIKKFNISLIILYMVSLGICIPSIYLLTFQQVRQETEKELSILVDMVKSLRSFIGQDVRPYLLPKNIIFPPAISSTVATKRVAARFKKRQPDYYIQISSDNPLNLENEPEPLEKRLLARYRENRDLKQLIEVGVIDGKSYLVSSQPEIVKSKNCLICHGDPKDAPKEITDTYGDTHGFGWELGTVAGVSAVGVPLADVDSIAFKRSATVTSFLTLLFGVLFLIITYKVKRHIVSPLVEIAKTAEAVSKGDIEKSLSTDRNDEIGDLSNSFELLRRSYVMIMKRLKKKN